jgi:hypothetical protein
MLKRTFYHGPAARLRCAVVIACLFLSVQVHAQHGALFIENKGQWPSEVKFLYRAGSLDLWITDHGATYDIHREQSLDTIPKDEARRLPSRLRHPNARVKRIGHVVSMAFEGTDSTNAIASDPQPGIFNYFIGNDSTKWETNVHSYSTALIQHLYHGIDARFYVDSGRPRYDLIVKPGADPSNIAMIFNGQDSLAANGDSLTMKTSLGDLQERDLFAYQLKDGVKQRVDCRFAQNENGSVTFALGNYDRTEPLVIDPLIYSTYLGGSGDDEAYAIATDTNGDAYVTGSAAFLDFPTTPGAYQTTVVDVSSAFITKLNPSGSALIYSTYIGGVNGQGGGTGIALDAARDAFITGYTSSQFYPTTPGAFLASIITHTYIAVTKLNATGTSLLYSTYLGEPTYDNSSTGGDDYSAIAVDSAGNAYITGSALVTPQSFPPTPGAFQTTNSTRLSNVFVTKLNSSGSALVYSARFGGTNNDFATDIAIDTAGNAFICGETGYGVMQGSTNFPTTPGAYQDTNTNPYVADMPFVTKLNSDGSALIYSTFLGGNIEGAQANSIAIDRLGNAYVTGFTSSFSPDDSLFQTTPGAFQQSVAGNNGFVVKLNATGTDLSYATMLGGTDDNGFGAEQEGIVVDANGNAYIIGGTYSSNYPTTIGAFQSSNGGIPGSSVTFTELNSTGSNIIYSTYLGGDNAWGSGVARDSSGNIYLTGAAFADYPITSGAYQIQDNGGNNGFVTKINLDDLALAVHSTSACDSATAILQLQNPSGGTMVIDSITTAEPFQQVPIPLPLTLENGDSTTILMSITGQASGTISSTATVYYHTANQVRRDTVVALSASITPPIPIGLGFAPLVVNPQDSSFYQLQIYFDPTLDSATAAELGLQTITLTLHLNTNLLTPVTILPADSGVKISETSIGPDSVTFTVTLPENYLADSNMHGIIVTLQHYVTDSLSTIISLTAPTLSFDSTAPCYAVSLPNPILFSSYQCGDSILAAAMLGAPPFSITGIVPNPAQHEITILVDAADPGSIGGGDAGEGNAGGGNAAGGGSIHAVEVEMYDALGRVVTRPTTPPPPPIPLIVGDASSIGGGVVLDVSGVPSGIYFVRVSEGGYVQSRSVVVQH